MPSAPKIVLVGGGSGGHITPLVAVAHELKKINPEIRTIYVGEKRGKFSYIAEKSGAFDEHHYVSAGKLRRYHGESFLKRITDAKTIFLNIRDVFRLLAGVFQSIWLFRKLNADGALLKGGYVCVPASIGAKLSGIPMITHDSDAMPGLSNRFAARFAKYHATAMPPQYYSYSKDSIRPVGLPVNENLKSRVAEDSRKQLGLNDAVTIFITGGSNGARRINKYVISVLEDLLKANPDVQVIHQVGTGNMDQYDGVEPRLKEKIKIIEQAPSNDEFGTYASSADIIITRAGATSIAEFAALGKACILIPHPELTGGHQLKNAKVYEDKDAAVVLQEKDLEKSPTQLNLAVQKLVYDVGRREELAKNLRATLPEKPAARALADLLVEVAK